MASGILNKPKPKVEPPPPPPKDENSGEKPEGGDKSAENATANGESAPAAPEKEMDQMDVE